jgi:hypothetical protein
MLKTAANPGGLPMEVFDGLRQQLAANRAQFYWEFAGGPFYGYNRPGAKPLQGVIENWWRADRRFRAALLEVIEEGDSEGPPGVPARHVYDTRRRDQFRASRLREELTRTPRPCWPRGA